MFISSSWGYSYLYYNILSIYKFYDFKEIIHELNYRYD